MAELRANDVEIYTFPTDDETVSDVNKDMNEMMPFAGSFQLTSNYFLSRAF
jgi:septin 6/8/11